MERKVGEVFTYNGKTYQVVKGTKCAYCDIGRMCILKASIIGPCTPSARSDKTNVVFKEINNMEIKNNQLTINIPEGMEIDFEKSNLAKGIIKFKKKDITYDDILQAYTIRYGSIVVSSRNIDKLLAISKLMDIAKYYNGDWKYKVNSGERGYMIAYDRSIKNPYYKVNIINPTSDVYYGNPVFKNEADAQYVIENPNFRDILDAVYKN